MFGKLNGFIGLNRELKNDFQKVDIAFLAGKT